MLDRIQDFIAAPVFPEDEEKTRLAHLLNPILLVLTGVLVFLSLAILFIFPERFYTAIVILATLAVLLVARFAMRRGRVRLASQLFIAGLWFDVTLIVLLAGGMTSIDNVFYLTLLVFTGLLLGRRATIALTLFIILTGLVMVILDAANAMPPRVFPVPPRSGLIMLATAVILAAATLILALKSLEEARAKSEKELAERIAIQAALAESEQRFHTIFDSVNDAIFVHDPKTGAILDVNQRMCEMYGVTRQEALQLTIEDLSQGEPPYTQRDALGWFHRIPLGGSQLAEWYAKDKHGRLFWVEVNLRHTVVAGQERMLVAARDINERKKADQRRSALYRISDAARAAQNLDDFYQLIHAVTRTLMHARNFYIAIYDPDTELLSYPYYVDEFDQPPPPDLLDKGLTAYVIRTSEPLLATPEIFQQLIAEGAVESVGAPGIDWLGAPLRTSQGVIGVLAVQTYTAAERLTQDDQDVLVFISNQVAMMLARKRAEEHDRLFSQGLRAVIEAADELIRCEQLDTLYRRAVELAREKLGAERVGLFLLDPEGKHLVGTYGTDDRGRTTDEHTDRESIDLHPDIFAPTDRLWYLRVGDLTYWDGEKPRLVSKSWIAGTVIRSLERPIGVLFNDTAISKKPLDVAIQETLAVYCSRIGNLIERIRLEERQRETARRLHAVVDCADELIRCENLDTLYRRTVELAREKIGAERVGLFLLDQTGQNLQGTYGTDTQGHTTDEHGATEAASNHPYLFNPSDRLWHVRTINQAYWEGDKVYPLEPGWVAGTVIRSVSQPIGILFNDSAISRTPLNETVQETLLLYSSLLGNIIERKRLEERQRDTARRLHAVVDCADELIRCEDLDTVYRRAVELAREKLSVERCAIFLLDETHEYMLGTYGTDDKGQTTDEHQARWAASSRPEILTGGNQTRLVRQNDEHTYWQNGNKIKVDQGWVAFTLIHIADELFGVFCNDNLLSHTPPNDTVQETIAIYCSLLGNIIDRKRSEERERDMARRLHGVVDTADELISCDNLDTLYRRAVELAREKLFVERCSIYILNETREYLAGTYGTDDHLQTTAESLVHIPVEYVPELFDPGTQKYFIRDNVTPVYYKDGETCLLKPGWVASTIIRIADEPIGIFYNDTGVSHAPANESLQETIAIYCSLLGNIIKRKRSEEREHTMANLLHAVVDATDELIGCENLDTLYRRAVELAREKLNVERCSIFLLDEAGENMHGTYGTTDQGETSTEYSVQFSAELVPEVFSRQLQKQLIHEKQAQVYYKDGVGHLLNQGWIAGTTIGIAAEPIGIFYNDCAISGAPPNGTVQEAITIYCSLLGNIIKRMRVETDQMRLIAELEAKNSELERFAYTVSHDLKSPLITIRGFLGFLEKDAASGNVERFKTDIGRISEATNKMQQLLNGLLELSRVGRLMNPAELVSFEAIVREAIEIVRGQIDALGAEVIIQPEMSPVYGDRARLVEVVQNLLDNAIKFSRHQVNPRIEIGIRAQDEAGKTVFFVRDNGLGIDPQYHERIFGLFNKLDAQSEGTGIGLALVKRIIEFHGGRIWVESEGRGRGSTFYFSLPITKPQEPA